MNTFVPRLGKRLLRSIKVHSGTSRDETMNPENLLSPWNYRTREWLM